ncbi:MAG: serine hydrolase [Bacteroidota bacterium]
MTYSKLLSVLASLLLFSFSLKAQSPAIAIPSGNITIDGNIDDWPISTHWDTIGFFYGEGENQKSDFSAEFAATFDVEKKTFYVAVKVTDDDFLVSGKDHLSEDHMLLYFDAAHQRDGGSPVYFVGGDTLLEVHHKPGKFFPYNQFLSFDSVRMKRGRKDNQHIYEWQLELGDLMSDGTSFGLDFMIIDHDMEGGEDILIWTDSFGKSYSSRRIGDVFLANSTDNFGKISGKIDVSSLENSSAINEVEIVFEDNSKLWFKLALDSLGNYGIDIPKGNYLVEPTQFYTSPVFSSGFKQNTRRIEYTESQSVEVKPNETSVIETITPRIIPRPSISSSSTMQIETISPKEVDKFISEWKEYFQIPAVSVVLIREGEVFYDKTVGYFSNFDESPVNDQTLFEAASITKSVFATMVLRLAERGVIDLDRPLYEYLPFPNIKKDERSKLLTARIILGHQSGLPNWGWGGPGVWEGAGDLELNFEPGTEFGYSGEAFNYLGRVVEHITGKDLQMIFEEEILGPFKMEGSHFYYTDEQETSTALGHMHQYPMIKGRERIASPASSLSTNAHLFKEFVLGLMNEEGMIQESYNLIYTPYTELSSDQKIYDPEFKQHVSHGFFVQEQADGLLIAHGGNNGDYDCKFAYNPEQKYAYIVFTNSNLGDELVREFEKFLLDK